MGAVLGRIETIGSRDSAGRFQAISDDLDALNRARVRFAADTYKEVLSAEAPYGKGDPVHLADSFRVRTELRGSDAIEAQVYVVGPRRTILPMILRGTKPHPIFAKKGKRLRFYWQKGPNGAGVYFFAKVNHPGTKPNPFPARAYHKVRSGILEDLRTVARDAVLGYSGPRIA